jgi:hypothetical protein
MDLMDEFFFKKFMTGVHFLDLIPVDCRIITHFCNYKLMTLASSRTSYSATVES